MSRCLSRPGHLPARRPLYWLVVLPWLTWTTVDAQPLPDPPPQSSTAPAPLPDDRPWSEQVVQQSVDSVVLITVEGRDGQQAGLGSGFVVAEDGLIATNLHVIGEARPITVRLRNGQELPVTEVFASDRPLDLAVIRVEATGLRPLPLASHDRRVTQGEPIVALGNPMGLRHSVVSGVVSGEREIDGRQMIQIAIPIEPGNSGGPVLDQQGQVLGIVTLKSAVTANLGFAIQAAALRSLLASPNPIAISRWKTIGSLRDDEWSTVFGARWQQRSGQILVSESGNSFGGRALCLWKGSLPEGIFEFGAFIRLEDEAGAAGLVFGADGNERHYGFYPSAGRLRLTRFQGPTVYSWQILDEFSSPHYEAGRWNHLKVRLEGDKLTCYVNDHEVLTRTLDESASGRIGLAKFRDTRARFRQFDVAAKLPASQLSEDRLRPLRQQLDRISAHPGWDEGLLTELTRDTAASRQTILDRIDDLRQQADLLERLAEDVHVRDTCQQLAAVLAEASPRPKLAEAALLVSRLDNAELDVPAYLRQLDRLVGEIRDALPEGANPAQRLATLNRYLFEENGFHGSRTHYYQAANSYLDRVLDDREGLPITLSILYLELATRLDLTVDGVGLPGHFIVRFRPAEGEAQLLDVFDGGKSLTVAQARQMSEETSGIPFDEAFLDGVDHRAIVLRVLSNLQGLAQRQRDTEAQRRYLEAMVSLAPEEPSWRGMRAVIRHETGRTQAAIEDLDWFLDHAPAGIDLEAIRGLKQRFLQGH